MDQNFVENPAPGRSEFVDMEVMEVGPGQSSDNPRFGRFLAHLREHAGLSRADAAASLGVTAEYLRLIELGRRTPALGQMRSFLDAYGADGEVGKLQPGGDRPDLVVLDPVSGDPVVVQFKSRIREARGNRHHSSRRVANQQKGPDPQKPVYESPSVSRAAELGLVVSLLTRADDRTIRKVRDLLQGEVGTDAEDET